MGFLVGGGRGWGGIWSKICNPISPSGLRVRHLKPSSLEKMAIVLCQGAEVSGGT